MIPTTIPYSPFPSANIPPRRVDVWLPPGGSPAAPCPVLYMHDGQNLFDPALAYGGVTWGVAEALTRLIAEELVPPMIVVGIWNNGDGRWQEYLPQRPFAHNTPIQLLPQDEPKLSGPIHSDAYLRFLTNELKPFIDATYPTQPDRAHTYLMGSSMGGLISLYGLCEYPHIFGSAACLSTHWPAGNGAVIGYMQQHLPPPGVHKLYFDYGTETLDATYEPYQQQADAVMAQAGYTAGQDWLTRKFPGADHSEQAWQARVHIPLQFLAGHR